MIVRNEKETDHRHVEELIRKAFYNLYVPGCTEHYLARVMRGHEDFIPELDLVLWVIKADDRALTVDEQFWHGVVRPYRKRDPHVRPCLHRAGISADGLWQAAYGNVF